MIKALLFLLFVIGIKGDSYAAEYQGRPEPPWFQDEVIGATPAGIVIFANNGAYRLYGLMVDGSKFSDLVVGKVLACRPVGSFEVKSIHGILSRSRVVYCDATVNDENKRLDFGFVNWLVKNGVAREFCAESYGIYGRCPIQQFRMIESD